MAYCENCGFEHIPNDHQIDKMLRKACLKLIANGEKLNDNSFTIPDSIRLEIYDALEVSGDLDCNPHRRDEA